MSFLSGAVKSLRSFFLSTCLRQLRFLAFVLFAGYSCAPRDLHTEIEGTWKIDSVYTYYNGFSSMETTIIDLEQYTYLPDGQVNVSWMGSTRKMTYDLAARDTLKYFENEHEVSRYQIINLRDGHMILRKDKPPLFAGGAQDRYEIRYFSRVKPGKND